MKALRTLLLLAAGFAAGPALAQDYPNRLITLIVPYAAGQGADAAARLVADRLAARLGKAIVVENRPGAGGNIGAAAAAQAKPDGYTLLVGSNATHGANSALYAKLPFDPIKDFVPVAYIGAVPMVLVARPDFAGSDLPSLTAAAKAKPGDITVALPSTTARAVSYLLQKRLDISLNDVPYRGSSSATTDTLGGSVNLLVDTLIATSPLILEGKLKAIAVSSRSRATSLPDVPTLSESGLGDFDLVPWNTWFAPKDTPAAIIDKLNTGIVEILADPDVQKRLRILGYETAAKMNPAETAEFVKAEAQKWADLIRASGITGE